MKHIYIYNKNKEINKTLMCSFTNNCNYNCFIAISVLDHRQQTEFRNNITKPRYSHNTQYTKLGKP